MSDVVQPDSSHDATPQRPARRDFPPIWVISLADADVRRRNMTARLGAVGVPFRFFDAVDGRTRRLPDTIDGARVVRTLFEMEAGLASAASHRLLQRKIAEGDAEAAVILEDDATIPDDFVAVVESALAFDFDVFKLEGVNASSRRIKVGRVGRHDVIITSRPSVGGAGYLLRRAAARRICSLPVLDQMADYVFQDTRLRLRVLEMDPFCVQQDGATPSQIPFLPNASYVPERKLSISRLLGSLKRKVMLASIYGPRTFAQLEFRRIARWLDR
jgi:GR25 family glycosyltransferase involved in LPS biosynthesis